jgi:hypothetical protein
MALKNDIVNTFLNVTTPVKPLIKATASTEEIITNTEPIIKIQKTHSHYKIFDNPPELEKIESKPNIKTIKSCGHTNTKCSHIVGLEKNIVMLIYEKCKISHEKTTPPISIENIALSCNTTKLSAQKTIQRLEKKQILIRVEFKNGRNGWTRYGLPQDIYRELSIW